MSSYSRQGTEDKPTNQQTNKKILPRSSLENRKEVSPLSCQDLWPWISGLCVKQLGPGWLQVAPASCALQVLPVVGPLKSCLVNNCSRGVVWFTDASRNEVRGWHLVQEGSRESGGKESGGLTQGLRRGKRRAHQGEWSLQSTKAKALGYQLQRLDLYKRPTLVLFPATQLCLVSTSAQSVPEPSLPW